MKFNQPLLLVFDFKMVCLYSGTGSIGVPSKFKVREDALAHFVTFSNVGWVDVLPYRFVSSLN